MSTATAATDDDARADEPGAPVAKAGPSSTRSMVEWIVIIAGALVVAFVVKTFLLQAFFIPSGSMEPTLQIHDRVLVNKLSYKLHGVHRGDIVVFERPPAESNTALKDLIKRVIAVPGDTVESRDGKIFVNDRELTEPYVSPNGSGGPVTKRTIGKGQLWVMGDNRGNSQDSRYFGPIEQSSVVGRAFVRIWPLPDFGLL